MIAYPDTSFLCALYRTQTNSDRALAYRATMSEPLSITLLLQWEFRQSVRFQAYRHGKNPAVGYSIFEANKMIADLEEDLGNGRVDLHPCDFPATLQTGERISRNRTFSGGHRSFDLLHVATARVLRARDFLTFDANQILLARAEGFALPLQ